MPPNFDVPPPIDPESFTLPKKNEQNGRVQVSETQENYCLQIFQSSLNILAHIMIGATVGITLLFVFRAVPLGNTQIHILLSVLGYQLLMAQAILSLTNDNGWSSRLKLVDKRRAHWILQILGSGMAIAGSFLKILDKAVHWNSLHGQFGLVALVFTTVSLVNGLTSLYAHELRNLIPSNLSKITHICFGIIAFVMANVSVCYGFDKGMFKNWSTPAIAYTLMAFVGASTAIIIINPLITFYRKTKIVIKKGSL